MKKLIYLILFVTICSCEKSNFRSDCFEVQWVQDYGRSATKGTFVGDIEDDISWIQLDSTYLIIDTKTGDLIKEIPSGLSSLLAGSWKSVRHGSKIIFHMQTSITAYDFNTGDVVWKIDTKEDHLNNELMIGSYMELTEDILVVPKRAGFYVINVVTGTLENKVNLNDIFCLDTPKSKIQVRQVLRESADEYFVTIQAAIPGEANSLTFTSRVNISETKEEWRYTAKKDTTLGGTVFRPVITNMAKLEDKIIFLEDDVIAVDATTGDSLWHVQYDGLGFWNGFNHDPEQNIIYLVSQSDLIVAKAIDINGKELWSTQFDFQTSGQEVTIDGDKLFVKAGKLYALDRSNGKVLSSFLGEDGDQFILVHISVGETLVIGVSSTKVYGFRK